MTLTIVALIALVAGLAAAAATAFLAGRRHRSGTPGARLALPGLAFLIAALVVGGALYGLSRGGGAGEPAHRILETIQRHHPEAAAEIEAIRRETSPELAQRRSSELAQRYLPRHIPTTSDAAVLRFTSEMTKLFETLAQDDPETCKALTTSGRVSASFDGRHMQPALDAMADIIEDSVIAAQPPPPQQRAQELLNGVIQRVYAQPGTNLAPPQMLAQPGRLPARQLCDTMLAYYREILKLPPTDASVVLRMLMRGAR